MILVVLASIAGLAVESANWYSVRADLQHTADEAATAAAVEYIKANGSVPASSSLGTELTAAANGVAALNGVPAAQTTLCVGSSTTCSGGPSGNALIKVTVQKSLSLFLTRIMTSLTTINISATSWASINTSLPACVTALNPTAGTDVTISGNTTVNAQNCVIASASPDSDASHTSVKLNGSSSTLNIGGFYTGGTINSNGGVLSSSISQFENMPTTSFTDYAANNSSVKAALSHLSTVESLASSGTALYFDKNCTTAKATCLNQACCTFTVPAGTYSSVTIDTKQAPSTMVVTFSGGGTTTVTGGISVTNNNAVTLSFGSGQYDIEGSLSDNASTTTTFGAGMYTIGGGMSLSGLYCGNGTSFVMGAFPTLPGGTNSSAACTTDGVNQTGQNTLSAPCPSTSCTPVYGAIAGLLMAVPKTVANKSLSIASDNNALTLNGVLDLPSSNFTLGGNTSDGGVNNNNTNCLAIIASTVTLAGTPSISSCTNLQTSSQIFALAM